MNTYASQPAAGNYPTSSTRLTNKMDMTVVSARDIERAPESPRNALDQFTNFTEKNK